MKKLYTLALFTLSIYSGLTQNCQYLGPDQYLPCGATTTTITADFSQCSGGTTTPPKETTSYLVQNIPFAPQPATGTQVFLGDDQVSGVLPIGFSFCFYGNTYTNFYIGSNGWISFSAGQPATFTSAPIPSTAGTVPKNCVMGPWQDWHPGIGGQIRYQTQGTAPCRRLVVSFSTIPFFSCTSTLGTFQIILYEGTNIIENHITNKPACTQWAGGTAVQGIHNLAGTQAVTVPGRNSTAWTTTNNAHRYTPNGANVTPTITWFQVGNPTPIATNVPSITVTPPVGGAYYTATYTYTGCYANYMACVGGGTFVQDTVYVQPMMNQTVQFSQSPGYCAGFPIPPLPTTSNNGITGTWSPAINNQTTTTYTFTPTPGQCADPYTQTITITPNLTPTFTPQGSFCIGSNIPPLPSTSQNGFSGTWSPAINNQATTTYTFTPNAGLCATATNLTIDITPLILPTFTQMGPYCSGAVIPPLSTTSLNGISGTWSPAMNNQTTTTYTFTPNAGQCADQTTMTVVIPQNNTPTFAAVGPYCSGANIPALPSTSLEGYTGAWSPAINNTATTTYTFTATPGQCASNTTLTVTINPNITPTFANVGPFCIGTNISPLPTTSQNGFTGSWSPAINNQATTTYTFSPSAGQCATTASSTITITPLVLPLFNQLGPYCAGGTIPSFPTQSSNGFTGVWSPAPNNSQTTTYTFTSNPNQCAANTTMTVNITPVTPSVSNLSLCQNALPYSWNGQNINAAGQFQANLSSPSGCDSIAILNLTLLPTLTSTTNVSICQNQAPYLWNGLTLSSSGTSTLTLTSVQGCDSIATLNLTVNPTPQVNFTANISAGCAPVDVVFNPTGTNNGNCQWNLGNGVILNNCGPVTGTYSSFGCYDVSLQVTSSAGCTSTLTLEDIVCVNPQPEASFVVSPQQLSNFDPTANFTNTSSGHVSQIWNFGDGSGTSSQANPQHTYPQESGYYYVTLVVANSHGCIDSAMQLVTVENEVIFYIPNTFTPDGDLFNEQFLPIFTAGFDIYNYQLLIFNRWGEVIFESNDARFGWDGTYGGNICPDGTYIWQIKYKELGKDKHQEIRGHFHLLR
jgi:gliding motility-associated-like protein